MTDANVNAVPNQAVNTQPVQAQVSTVMASVIAPKESAPVPAPGATPTPPIEPFSVDESWKKNIPEDILKDPTIRNIKSVADMAKMLQHSQKMIGSEKIPVPNEHTTPEEWTKIYRKLGVPEDVAKYQEMVQLPDGLDKEASVLKTVLETSHKVGVRPSQAQEIIKAYQEVAVKELQAQEVAQQEKLKNDFNGLRQEWGNAFEKKIESAKNGLRAVLGQEADNVINDPVLGNNPTFIKIMEKFGALASEDKLKGDYAGDMALRSPSEAQKEINRIMGDRTGPYYDSKHPDHKRVIDEVLNLHRMKLAQQ